MKQKTRIENIKQAESHIDKHFALKLNCIRFGEGETTRHFIAKALVCKELMRDGHEIATEVRLNTGGRCDIYSLSENIIYEILETESINNNKPYPVRVIKLQAKKILEKWKPHLYSE